MHTATFVFCSLSLAAALSWSPAAAMTPARVIYAGTLGNPGTPTYELLSGSLPLNAGSRPYSFKLWTAAPITGGYLYEDVEHHVHFFDSHGGSMGGSSNQTQYLRFTFPATLGGLVTLGGFASAEEEPAIVYAPSGAYEENYYDHGFTLDLAFDPASYGSAYTFTISAVPEPGLWSAMIIGLGGVGLALRRARRDRSKALGRNIPAIADA